jgi:hypothetical protein
MSLRFTFIFLIIAQTTLGQTARMRTVAELINKQEPGWDLVTQWIKEAKNKVEVLPKDGKRAEQALYETQVTTRSPMGAVIYESGGILVDGGWIRILGSGSARLNRSLIGWNMGKTMNQVGERPSFLLIADDAIGGFFAINAGAFGPEETGKVFYFSPDNLEWESLGIGYSEFLTFCFSGDLNQFYQGLRWNGWQTEVKVLDGNKGINCFPFLWTTEGKDINKVSRRPVPIEELWTLYNEHKK